MERIARVFTRRHGIRVEPSEVPLLLFWHEAGHHLRRDRLLAMLRRNGLSPLSPSDREAVETEEREADLYALRRFVEWIRGAA